MEQEFIITYFEFDAIGNLIVETLRPETVDAFDAIVKEISSKNILSHPITVRSYEEETSVRGFIFSVHEFQTTALAMYLEAAPAGGPCYLTRSRLMKTSRLNVPKTINTVYLKNGGQDNEAHKIHPVDKTVEPVDVCFEPNDGRTHDSELEATSESYTAELTQDLRDAILGSDPNFPTSIKFNSGRIQYGGYAIQIAPQDSDALEEIITAIFPADYQPQSKFIDRLRTVFVFSRNEFDIYRMYQLMVDGTFVLTLDQIIDNKLATINQPKDWDMKEFLVPNDYYLIIDGQTVECERVTPKRRFIIFDDTKPKDFLAFDSGLIGCVSEVRDDAIVLSYYRNADSGEFINGEIIVDRTYIESYNGHLANGEEMDVLRDCMIEKGYIIDPETRDAVKKYPWLNKNVVYFMPFFDQDIYDFVVSKKIFTGSKSAYIEIYKSKTPIFNNQADCQALVDKYNESMTEDERDIL